MIRRVSWAAQAARQSRAAAGALENHSFVISWKTRRRTGTLGENLAKMYRLALAVFVRRQGKARRRSLSKPFSF